jgi:hypothetical protein
VLDPLDTFDDPDDIVWAKDREIRRVHELIVQGYYDAGYEPVFVGPDSAAARLDFICANLRLPTARPAEPQVRVHEMGIYKRYFDLVAPVAKPPRSESTTPAVRNQRRLADPVPLPRRSSPYPRDPCRPLLHLR